MTETKPSGQRPLTGLLLPPPTMPTEAREWQAEVAALDRWNDVDECVAFTTASREGKASTPMRPSPRMRWPGEPAGYRQFDCEPDRAAHYDGSGSGIDARRGSAATAQSLDPCLELPGSDRLGLPPVPGHADLDVPVWWLEERARVVADDLRHRSRAGKPS